MTKLVKYNNELAEQLESINYDPYIKIFENKSTTFTITKVVNNITYRMILLNLNKDVARFSTNNKNIKDIETEYTMKIEYELTDVNEYINELKSIMSENNIKLTLNPFIESKYFLQIIVDYIFSKSNKKIDNYDYSTIITISNK